MIYKNTIPVEKLDHELNIISDKLGHMVLPKGFKTFVLYVISELFVNVSEHSQAKKAEVLVKISKQVCAIHVADKGIGLKKSYVLKNVYVKDDFSAIEFAVSGLSTKDVTQRGFGLYSIRKLTQGLKGKMIITTGMARAILKGNKIVFQNMDKGVKGVRIDLNVPVKNIDFYKYVK